MILKRITSENLDYLDWYETVIELEYPIYTPECKPKVRELRPFYAVQRQENLLVGYYYFSNSVRIY
jgi:hypothetical protein